MQNKCLTPNITYKATVINNTDIVKKNYFALCETFFNERYHTRSFRLQSYSKDTELSTYIWELKMKIRFPLLSGEF